MLQRRNASQAAPAAGDATLERRATGSHAEETVKVFGAMPLWRPAVGWVELAKPSFQALTVLPMLGFVPQPSLQRVLAQSLDRGNQRTSRQTSWAKR